uniref:BioF2-like acetyltransferase domain-containing protein n=1 Tax=Rhodopseudomonas palustris (strain BisA53) TaxID=316055 RepID=Q07RA3_RHOP5
MLDQISLTAWQDLATRAAEPNGYNLPEWVLAANGADANVRALTATGDDATLIGVVPVLPLWRTHRIPLPVLVTADPFRSLDTPLLDRDRAEQAAARLMAQAREAGAHALLLRYVVLDGLAAQAFTSAADQQGLRPRLLQDWKRAFLDARADGDATPTGLSAKKLKELRRLRHRLAEHGEVSFAVARERDEVARAFDQFLTLEASGWKGQRGTALQQQPELADRLRRAALSLAAQGRCEIITLCAGPTPVAAGVVLRHLDRAFFFKLGIDEAFARFSPGVQLTLELTTHLRADPQIASADSTAKPGHPMIDPIWRERITIGDLLIPLRGNDPLLPLIEASLHGHAKARALALRLLRR